MFSFITNHVVPLLWRTYEEWQKDECLDLGTSLAYSALFSLFPLLLVLLSVVGAILGPDSGLREQILTLTRESLPPEAFGLVENTLNQLNTSSGGAGIIGFATLLVSASNVFGALDRAFDKIWNVQPKQDDNANWMAAVLRFLQQRAIAFALVLGCGLLVMLSMLSGLVLDVTIAVAQNFTATIGASWLDLSWLWHLLQLAISFLILVLVLMLLYKVLPSTRVAWRDVWLGALLAAVLFLLVQQLVVGSIISLGGSYASYGVVGGVMLLLFWIFLMSQILFIGGELTFAYANMYGSRRTKNQEPRTENRLQLPVASLQPESTQHAARSTQHAVAHGVSSQTAAGLGVVVGALGTLALLLGGAVVSVLTVVRRLRRGNVKRET